MNNRRLSGSRLAAAAPLPVTSLLKLKPHSKLPSLVSAFVCLLFQIYRPTHAERLLAEGGLWKIRNIGRDRGIKRESEKEHRRTEQAYSMKFILLHYLLSLFSVLVLSTR